VLKGGDEHDKIIETGHSSGDAVELHFATPVAYVLANGIESLQLFDAASTATGNALGNSIFGMNGGVAYHLDGGGGSDLVTGNQADDVLAGGAGDDLLNGGEGADHLSGGAGNDRYLVDNAGDVVTESANAGTDTVFAEVSFDLGVNGANVENLTLTGSVGHEGHGNGLNNVIVGTAGNDVLTGEAGNDVLVGSLGQDTLSGGAGSDTFRYSATSIVGLEAGDTITDFESGHDKIDVHDLFSDLGLSHTGDATAGGHLLLVQNGNDTLVQFDADGAGGAAPVTLATVVNATVGIHDIIH